MITIKEMEKETDGSTIYSATVDKEYTVSKFIDELLKANPELKGSIRINDRVTGFENGRLIDPLPIDISSSKFIYCTIEGTEYKTINIYIQEYYIDTYGYKEKESELIKPIPIPRVNTTPITRVVSDILPPIQIRYHHELYPELEEVKLIDNGDYVDLRAAEDIELKQFEFAIIPLGVSMKLPDGYYAILTPRSSTFKKYGIIQTNSIGIIDNSYSGDNDIWGMPVLAMRDTKIKANDRICQFTISKSNAKNMRFEKVDKLDGKDRGGFGSTGVK